MKLIDIINGPWAITPDMLSEIRSIYARHLRGEKINIKDIEGRIGEPLKNKPQGYDLINGAAIIPIEGVIAKKMNLFMQISGGASTQMIERDLKAALNDPSVQKIILNIDSPGGTIDGTFELANLIFESRGKKPIIAYTDGSMLSAAYAIGSAADKIYISGDTTAIGSIGVVAAHEDISKMEEKLGIKTTEIYAGKYKRIASQFAPLSAEGFSSIKDQVDYLYALFISEVAKFRGVSAEDVLQKMSTDVQSIFRGKQALTAGLVDGISTIDRLISSNAAGSAAGIKIKGKENKPMTREELIAQNPELYQAVMAEGKTGMDEAITKAKEESAKAETARIQSVRAQLIPGHEAIIEALMFDGKTTGPEAAVAVLDAEKKQRIKAAADFKADGQIKVPATEPGDGANANTMKRKEFNALDPMARAEFIRSGGKVAD